MVSYPIMPEVNPINCNMVLLSYYNVTELNVKLLYI